MQPSALLANRAIALQLTDAAKKHLATVDYDTAFCARTLKRAIQQELQDPISLAILESKYRTGSTVKVDVQDRTLVLE